MFTTVLDVESRLPLIVARRRAYVAQQTAIHYQALISTLIQHGTDHQQTYGT